MAELHSLQNENVQSLITQHIDLWTGAVKDKSSAGRGSSSKRELYGIKKLRELILELAVRGKLVAQDPNDEPASVLLERIAAEKAELVKQGKIKKPKKLPEISEDEMGFEQPEGWSWTRVGEVSEFVNGFAFKSKDFTDSGIGIVKIGDITSNSQISELGMSFVPPSVVEGLDESLQIKHEDLVIAMSGATTGKLGFNQTDKVFYLNQRVGKFVTHLVERRFLFLPLKARVEENLAISAGSAIPNLSTAQIISIPLCLPPLDEQHRIVAKVDELMALCDQLEQQTESSLDAHQTLVQTLLDTLLQSFDAEELEENWQRLSAHFDLLFTTEQSIDQLKQTILQLAVMGKLVPQDPNDEPASELLKRIAAEKEELVKQKKIKKQKPLPPISDDEKPFRLPKGWEWCRLQSLITEMDAGWSPACPAERSPSDNVWGVLKTTAVQLMEYREHENKVLPESKDPKPQYEVKKGDILITRAGPKNRVGISCLVMDTRPKLMISDKIIRFHLAGSDISERFVSLCINVGATAEYLENSKSGMAESQMNISQDKLKQAPIHIPPASEQNRVIAKVDQLMALCDQLKAKLTDSKNTQLNLADVLVAQAV